MDEKKQNSSTIAGVVFVGCFLIGLGLGILYNLTVVGLFLGMGVGFVSMGIIWAYFKQK